jgi:hypothetical protein
MPTKEEIRAFSSQMENLTRELRCEIMDAILHHCQETGLEVEVAATLISPTLKSKIREQAEANNQIRKSSRLPV